MKPPVPGGAGSRQQYLLDLHLGAGGVCGFFGFQTARKKCLFTAFVLEHVCLKIVAVTIKGYFYSTVINRLRNGMKVIGEAYDSVTIMFIDIYGFGDVVMGKTPSECTAALNEAYSVFDPTIVRFDVYKVETIGSVYMVLAVTASTFKYPVHNRSRQVSSGVPYRNENRHAGEICLAAATLLAAFNAKYEPSGILSFMAGINSGDYTKPSLFRCTATCGVLIVQNEVKKLSKTTVSTTGKKLPLKTATLKAQTPVSNHRLRTD